MTRTLAVVCVLLALGQSLPRETPPVPQPPTLTEIQKLQLTNAVQRVQIAQLQVQAAQTDLQQAGAAAQTLVASLKVDGYELDLQTLAYKKTPPPPPPVKK